MNTQDVIIENAVIASDIGMLSNIHLTGKNIAIFERDLSDWDLNSDQPIDFRAHGSVAGLQSALELCFLEGFSDASKLKNDIFYLLETFAQITGVASFRMVFTKIETTMCPRFHADHNQLRMICTYTGPGTLWLPDKAVNRKAYRRGKANRKILPDETLAQQANTGDVLLLKGALYPGAVPILHRSPDIDAADGDRLFLSIDPNAPLVL
ncbi:MAG: DUF1826 domain-containing protein [Flavobacteriaceae bacterium]|nr:DUF1826 domain-containing protein [Flavobacteriaceae bacterium]